MLVIGQLADLKQPIGAVYVCPSKLYFGLYGLLCTQIIVSVLNNDAAIQ